MVGDFKDYRGDIAIVEEVLMIAQERIAVIPLFVVEGILEELRVATASAANRSGAIPTKARTPDLLWTLPIIGPSSISNSPFIPLIASPVALRI